MCSDFSLLVPSIPRLAMPNPFTRLGNLLIVLFGPLPPLLLYSFRFVSCCCFSNFLLLR